MEKQPHTVTEPALNIGGIVCGSITYGIVIVLIIISAIAGGGGDDEEDFDKQ